MTTRQLVEPILDGGLRSINFFNGRLLTAEDLNKEQEANRQEHRYLGQAIGDGIVSGLEVAETLPVSSRSQPVITVQPGLAVNRQGETLSLQERVDLSLVRPVSASAVPALTTFGDCHVSEPGVYIAGAGLYLLTILPAQGTEGRALVSGLGNVSAGCSTRYNVEGVQFRLIQLDLSAVELADQNRLRNRVAHKCFGSSDPDVVAFLGNVLGPSVNSYGTLDDLRPNRLTNCEVPLAVLYWTAADGLKFIDMWSVRRRITSPEAAARWPLLLSDRRLSEAESIFWQFQNQIQDIQTRETNLTVIRARDHFRFVPPVGIIPLNSSRWPRGFVIRRFFENVTHREPAFMEGARLAPLLSLSLAYPPVDLESGVMLWLYVIRENIQAIDANPTNPPQTYLVFASGHIPYQGDSHYDVNRWNYSQFH